MVLLLMMSRGRMSHRGGVVDDGGYVVVNRGSVVDNRSSVVNNRGNVMDNGGNVVNHWSSMVNHWGGVVVRVMVVMMGDVVTDDGLRRDGVAMAVFMVLGADCRQCSCQDHDLLEEDFIKFL